MALGKATHLAVAKDKLKGGRSSAPSTSQQRSCGCGWHRRYPRGPGEQTRGAPLPGPGPPNRETQLSVTSPLHPQGAGTGRAAGAAQRRHRPCVAAGAAQQRLEPAPPTLLRRQVRGQTSQARRAAGAALPGGTPHGESGGAAGPPARAGLRRRCPPAGQQVAPLSHGQARATASRDRAATSASSGGARGGLCRGSNGGRRPFSPVTCLLHARGRAGGSGAGREENRWVGRTHVTHLPFSSPLPPSVLAGSTVAGRVSQATTPPAREAALAGSGPAGHRYAPGATQVRSRGGAALGSQPHHLLSPAARRSATSGRGAESRPPARPGAAPLRLRFPRLPSGPEPLRCQGRPSAQPPWASAGAGGGRGAAAGVGRRRAAGPSAAARPCVCCRGSRRRVRSRLVLEPG